MTVLLTLWMACAEPVCPGPREDAAVASPSAGVVITSSPFIPALVRLEEPGEVQRVCLDGAVIATEPLVRKRNRVLGGGHDLIDAISLDTLEDGEHHVAWRVDDRWYGSRFILDRPPHRVDLRADGDARIKVLRDGKPLVLATPDAVQADPRKRDVQLSTVLTTDGAATLWLDDGEYTFLATRGVRDSLDRQTISVRGHTTLTFDIQRVVPTPGRVAADLHVHTGLSPDAFVALAPRRQSVLSSGLDTLVLSDHGNVSAIPGVDAVPGIEFQFQDAGKVYAHVNAFPLESAQRRPTHKQGDPTEGLAQWRTFAPDALLQVNHPRGIQFKPAQNAHSIHALFHSHGVGPWEMDLLEVMNRFSVPLYLQVREDWFGLLNQGHRVVGTGNSDSHGLEVELIGYPMNLVAEPVLDGLRAGDVSVTTGPVLTLRVGDAAPGSSVPVGTHQACVDIQSAPWVPVEEVRLVVDGQVLHRQPAQARHCWDLQLGAGSWVLAEAGWPLERPPTPDNRAQLGDYALVAPGYVPLAFTNPVFVD